MSDQKKPDVDEKSPIDQPQKSDTFFMVAIDGQKYLVDQTGKIVLKPVNKTASEPGGAPGGAPSSRPAAEPPPPMPVEPSKVAVPLKFRVKPGTPEFSLAVQEAESLLQFFVQQVHRTYRHLGPRFEDYLEQTRSPFIKYFERGKDGEANMKAYLIREFFSRTSLQERGLEILEFLTVFIARRVDGTFSHDRTLPPLRQKEVLVGFLDAISRFGDTPAKRQVMGETYRDFINQEYELMRSEGGVGFYLSSSLHQALKAQRDVIANAENRNYVDSTLQRLMRSQIDLFLDNMLAYIKALTIIRLVSRSRKEDRGSSEEEREWLFYSIIAYSPPEPG